MRKRDIFTGIRVRQEAFTGRVIDVRMERRLWRWQMQEFTVAWDLSHWPVSVHQAREAGAFTRIDMFGDPWPY